MPRLLPILLLIPAAVAGPIHRASADDRPNILIAFADDWGRYASAYAKLKSGTPSDLVSTPNFDRLAKEGVLLTRAFVNAPSCTPCRSSLLDGSILLADRPRRHSAGSDLGPGDPQLSADPQGPRLSHRLLRTKSGRRALPPTLLTAASSSPIAPTATGSIASPNSSASRRISKPRSGRFTTRSAGTFAIS